MSVFLLDAAPQGVTSSWVNPEFNPSVIVSRSYQFVPFGKAALSRFSTKVDTVAADGPKSNAFPEDKINIPVGVNGSNLGKYNLYQLLGFEADWADSADIEAIRKAFHKACLLYHPDKAGNQTEDRSVFLKIQEAFNTLGNDTKRRAYDSQLPFDESIPSEERVNLALSKRPEKFFKLYDPVFKRNARFATKKPVPEIGDMNTNINDVYRFYDYWVNFESWRDFTSQAEHKPDDAQGRDEKRWMQKENERVTKKLKKKEMERLIGKNMNRMHAFML